MSSENENSNPHGIRVLIFGLHAKMGSMTILHVNYVKIVMHAKIEVKTCVEIHIFEQKRKPKKIQQSFFMTHDVMVSWCVF